MQLLKSRSNNIWTFFKNTEVTKKLTIIKVELHLKTKLLNSIYPKQKNNTKTLIKDPKEKANFVKIHFAKVFSKPKTAIKIDNNENERKQCYTHDKIAIKEKGS